MSWLFSRRMVDDYLSDMQQRIHEEAQRATLLLSDLPPTKQRERKSWSEDWSSTRRIQAASDQRRLLEDVCSEASIRQWSERDSCPCDGHGDAHRQTDFAWGMCSSHQRNKDRQQAGKSPADELFGTFQRAQQGINEEQKAVCEGALCVSLRYLRALVEEFLAATSSDGARSVLSSSNHTPQAFLPPDRMTAFSRPSRSGMTFGPLTEDLGAALLTWFLGDSRVRTYQLPGMAPESTVSDQGSGEKWHESSVRYDRDSSSWRTHRSLFEEDLPWSSVTLPSWGMTLDGVLWEPPTSGRPISVIASGLWPTPSGVTSGKNHVVGRLDEWGGSGNPLRGTDIAAVRCASFEEWMMGWPTGWSALTPLGMDKFHEWHRQHSPISHPTGSEEAA